MLAKKPLPFFTLVGHVFSHYNKVFLAIWPLTLLLAVVHSISFLLGGTHEVVAGAVSVIAVLAILYLFVGVLARSDAALRNKKAGLKKAFEVANSRYLAAVGASLIYIVVQFLLALINFGLWHAGKMFGAAGIWLAVGLFISLFIVVLLYFVIPIIVLDNKKVIDAFKQSIELVWQHWWRVFGVSFVVFGCLAVVGALFMAIFHQNHLLAIFGWNVFSQIFFTPIVVAQIIFLLNDIKLRSKKESNV